MASRSRDRRRADLIACAPGYIGGAPSPPRALTAIGACLAVSPPPPLAPACSSASTTTLSVGTRPVRPRRTRAIGAHLWRVTQGWQPGELEISGQDTADLTRAVGAAEQAGVRLVVAVYGNAAATPASDHGRGRYCGFVRSILVRFPQVRAVVIWNEVNKQQFPAMVVNARLDLLAWNRVYASFFDDIESIPTADRNILWLVFTHPEMQAAIVDREEVVGRLVAEYRGAMAEHFDDPAWKALLARLHRVSPEFAAVWQRHDVQGVESRTKRALHPTAGLLELVHTNLWIGEQVGTRIVAFSPVDDRTGRRLDALYDSLVAQDR
jgi:hypothetical protein